MRFQFRRELDRIIKGDEISVSWKNQSLAALLTAVTVLTNGPAVAQDGGEISPESLVGTGVPRPYSPYANRNFPAKAIIRR